MPCKKHRHKSRAAAEAHLRQLLSTPRVERAESLSDPLRSIYPCGDPDCMQQNGTPFFHVGHDPMMRTFAEEVQHRERQRAHNTAINTETARRNRVVVKRLMKRR